MAVWCRSPIEGNEITDAGKDRGCSLSGGRSLPQSPDRARQGQPLFVSLPCCDTGAEHAALVSVLYVFLNGLTAGLFVNGTMLIQDQPNEILQ